MDESQNNQKWLPRKLHQYKTWMRTHKRATAAIISVLLLIFGALAAWAFIFTPKMTIPVGSNTDLKLPEAEVVHYSPLTGVKVKDKATTTRQVTGIMLENSPDARPQSGMREAGIIYEAIAEGGITRFAALYQEKQPKLIGPVRSLRPYYLEWQAPYDPAFAHIGGSHKALQEVRNGKYKDIDQFFNSQAYWRSSDRYAPHNVYTSFDKLNALNKSKGFTSSKFTGFKRKTDAPKSKPNAKRIEVNISSGTYDSTYVYHAKSNSYLRHQGGEAHTDRESKKQLAPKVVIVMKVHMSKGFEDGWREQIKTTGKGDAFIFQDGTVKKVTWSKKGTKDPLLLKDKEGNDVALNAGQTWITALPNDRSVTWR